MQVSLHLEVQLGLQVEHSHMSPPGLLLPGQLGTPQDWTVCGHPSSGSVAECRGASFGVEAALDIIILPLFATCLVVAIRCT